MLNLSAPGVMSPNNDGAAQRKNSGPTHHGEYLDSNIVSMDIQKFDRRPMRHSVLPVEVQNNLMNDSQSNISGGDNSSLGSKSSKLGMLFQNINKKIRSKIEHSNSVTLTRKRSGSSSRADAAMPPPVSYTHLTLPTT